MRGFTAFQRVNCCRTCCVVWHRTRKRQGGITALWHGRPTLRDGRPTLWHGRPTLCEGRPTLRDAIGRHGALWDGRPMLWDGRRRYETALASLCCPLVRVCRTLTPISVSLPLASVGLPPSNSRLYTVCMPCMWDCNDKSGL